MTHEQKIAHERLLSILPVRTYEVPVVAERTSKGRSHSTKVEARRKQALSLKAKGMRVPKIAELMGLSRQHIYNYLRTRTDY